MSSTTIEPSATAVAALPLEKAAKPRFMPYGDALRVWGTIAVVFGHVADMPMFGDGQCLTLNWWVCNAINAVARWAVPVYIMLSGALLLDPARAESPKDFYRKRLARIGLPLFFWSGFFMWFSVYYTRWVTPHDAWINLIMGKPYAHLHFIFRIAGLYAMTPMLRVFLRHCSRPMLAGTVITLLCVWSADSVVDGVTGTELSAFARFAPFMGYYLAGYWLRDVRLSRAGLVWCALVVLVGMVVLTAGTGWLVHHQMALHQAVNPSKPYRLQGFPSIDMLLYDFLSPVRIPMGICSWLILTNLHMNMRREGSWYQSAVKWIAPTTLGLYLVHPMFRELLWQGDYFSHIPVLKNIGWLTSLRVTEPNVWIGIPATALLVYVPSLLLVAVWMRIPYLRRLVN